MQVADWEVIDVNGPEIPEWAQEVLRRLNTHLEHLTTALQGNVTAEQNTHSEIISLDVEHETEVRVRLRALRGKPIGARILWTEVYPDFPTLSWRVVDQDLVDLQVSFSTAPSGEKQVRILFESD